MPHYVIELEEPDTFAVYSTIVDGLLTQPMDPKATRDWLVEKDYTSWLTPYDTEEVVDAYPGTISDSMARLLRDQARYFYWHEAGQFCYAKLEDAYFCLPRGLWRNG